MPAQNANLDDCGVEAVVGGLERSTLLLLSAVRRRDCSVTEHLHERLQWASQLEKLSHQTVSAAHLARIRAALRQGSEIAREMASWRTGARDHLRMLQTQNELARANRLPLEAAILDVHA